MALDHEREKMCACVRSRARRHVESPVKMLWMKSLGVLSETDTKCRRLKTRDKVSSSDRTISGKIKERGERVCLDNRLRY